MSDKEEAVIILPREEFEELLAVAAERGARRALAEVGLDGADAPADIRDLRGLMAAIRSAKSTAWQTATRILTTLVIALVLAFIGIKTDMLGLIRAGG